MLVQSTLNVDYDQIESTSSVFFIPLSHFSNIEIGIPLRAAFAIFGAVIQATSGAIMLFQARRLPDGSCRRESGVVVCRNLPLYEILWKSGEIPFEAMNSHAGDIARL